MIYNIRIYDWKIKKFFIIFKGFHWSKQNKFLTKGEGPALTH